MGKEKDLVALLKEWRAKNGYSQREVAEKIGVSLGYIGQIEVGGPVSPATLYKLERLYGAPEGSLVGWVMGRRINQMAEDFGISSHELARLIYYLFRGGPQDPNSLACKRGRRKIRSIQLPTTSRKAFLWPLPLTYPKVA